MRELFEKIFCIRTIVRHTFTKGLNNPGKAPNPFSEALFIKFKRKSVAEFFSFKPFNVLLRCLSDKFLFTLCKIVES
jgi:hypothetical protein